MNRHRSQAQWVVVVLALFSGLVQANADADPLTPPAQDRAVQEEMELPRTWDESVFIEGSFGPMLGSRSPGFFVSFGLGGGRKQLSGPFGLGLKYSEILLPEDDKGRFWQSLVPPVYGHFVPYVTWSGCADPDGHVRLGTVVDFYIGGSPIAAVHSAVEDPELNEPGVETDWWWHWYVRGGVRVTFELAGLVPRAGVDLGAMTYGSDETSTDSAVCTYAAFYLHFGEAGFFRECLVDARPN